jgi:hypothetical protein
MATPAPTPHAPIDLTFVVFASCGDMLGVLSTGTMVFILFRSKAALTQMRPRFLAKIVGTDLLWSFSAVAFGVSLV